MKLEEVLPALREGKRIRRKCGGYIFIKEGSLSSSSGYFESLDGDDVFADDWEIVPEPKKFTRWINLYRDGSLSVHLDKHIADESTERIEFRKIEWEVGD